MGLIILTDEQKKAAKTFARDVILRGNDDAYNHAVLSLLYDTEYAITQALDFGRDLSVAAEEDKAIDSFRMDSTVGGLRELRDHADKLLRLFESKREEILDYSKHSHVE